MDMFDNMKVNTLFIVINEYILKNFVQNSYCVTLFPAVIK